MDKYFIGVMTGTSADALDGCLVSFDKGFKLINTESIDLFWDRKGTYKETYEKCIKAGYKDMTDHPDMLRLDNAILKTTNTLVDNLILDTNIEKKDVHAIGFSGQTTHHTYTESYQLGNPMVLANSSNIRVIADFRQFDIKNGGMGAPLIPVFHKYLFAEKNKNKLIFNIGGIANGTYLNGEKVIMGTDVGPGNCLLDLVASKKLGTLFDTDGIEASKGEINNELLDTLMKKEMAYPRADDKKAYYNLVPWLYDENYRNTDKYNPLYNKEFLKIKTPSLLRTFSEYTAEKIKEFYIFCDCPNEVIFHGGGTMNIFLMELIKDKLGVEIKTTDNEIPSKFVEAAAFAYLAFLEKGEIFEPK